MSGGIDQKLAARGLVLPAPMQLPPGLVLPFSFCKTSGRRARPIQPAEKRVVPGSRTAVRDPISSSFDQTFLTCFL